VCGCPSIHLALRFAAARFVGLHFCVQVIISARASVRAALLGSQQGWISAPICDKSRTRDFAGDGNPPTALIAHEVAWSQIQSWIRVHFEMLMAHIMRRRFRKPTFRRCAMRGRPRRRR